MAAAKAGKFSKVFRVYGMLLCFVLMFASGALATCEDCWNPNLNFDIEEQGLFGSMIFISGHSYALSIANEELSKQGKENYFCKEGGIGSRELMEMLNEKLSGIVTSEQVTYQIAEGLEKRYPCKVRPDIRE